MKTDSGRKASGGLLTHRGGRARIGRGGVEGLGGRSRWPEANGRLKGCGGLEADRRLLRGRDGGGLKTHGGAESRSMGKRGRECESGLKAFRWRRGGPMTDGGGEGECGGHANSGAEGGLTADGGGEGECGLEGLRRLETNRWSR